MQTDDSKVRLETVDCSLFTRRTLVAVSNNHYLQWNLEK